MEAENRKRLSREDWIAAALELMFEKGAGGVKVVVLAQRMGVTSGSFYWHFKKLQDLLDAVLDHWEHHLTDHIIRDAQAFTGPPPERIYKLMEQVIAEGAAEPDHAISVWSKTDDSVAQVFHRTVHRRFDFAAWMFAEAGFPKAEARTRGRIMVAYLMGESSAGLKADADWQDTLRAHWKVLVTSTA